MEAHNRYIDLTEQTSEETRRHLVDLTLESSLLPTDQATELNSDNDNDTDNSDVEILDCPSPATLRGDASDDNDDIRSIPVVNLEGFVSESSSGSRLNAQKQSLQYFYIDSADTWLFPGTDIELTNERFLRIDSIFQIGHESEVFLEGLLFLKTGLDRTCLLQRNLIDDDEDLSCLFIGYENEIFWLISYLEDDERDERTQSLRTFPVTEFCCLRTIRMTNQENLVFNPSTPEEPSSHSSNNSHGDLFCRWKGKKTWPDARTRKMNTLAYCSRTISRLRAPECDSTYSVNDKAQMDRFRGSTKKGGSKIGIDNIEWQRKMIEEGCALEAERRRPALIRTGTTIILDTPPQSPIEIPDEVPILILNDDCSDQDESQDTDDYWKATSKFVSVYTEADTQRYTFGDIFCGGGGATRAAIMAGLCVLYGNDIKKEMCDSYSKNFPWAQVACCDARAFASAWAYGDLKTDILHLSNPCQTFSKAHTTVGQNDEKNRNNIFLFERFLRRVKPRIVTVENADGIIYSKNWEYVEYLIRQFTVMGYSVEFRTMRFADYGLCQQRKRFVLIAACPGQKLPGFPKPTHCNPKEALETGLPSWIGLGDAIDHIPVTWNHHNLSTVKAAGGPPYPRERQCTTLLTKGSDLCHYSGWRQFTVQELSAIQSFPLFHEFGDGQSDGVKKVQIGNAVPPAPFAQVFRHIVKKLLEDDNMLDENGNRRQHSQ